MTSHLMSHSSACCQDHHQWFHRHLQSKQSLSVRYQCDGEAERSIVQSSLSYSARTSEVFLTHLNLLHLQLFFKRYFTISVKVLFIEFTCNMYCAQQEHVAVSSFCQVSQVTVLYYQSMFIAVFILTVLLSPSWEAYGKCMFLPSMLDLQDLLSPATICMRTVQDSCH